MSEYLLLYTINKSNSETQATADSRRNAFDNICLANKYRPVDGHQTAYTFSDQMSASYLFNALVKQAERNETPLLKQDKLFIGEINSMNKVNG